MRKTGLAWKRVKLFGHCMTQIHQCRTDIHADILNSHTGYEVISYFRSAFVEVRKKAENATSDGFRPNFSVTAFCLPHRLVGFLLFISIATVINVRKFHKEANCTAMIVKQYQKETMGDCNVGPKKLKAHGWS